MNSKIKVMVVEDSGLIVQRLYALLGEIDFIKSVAHARNGEEALTLMKLINPHLVILDIKIPIINGIEVLKHLKKNYQDVKVIMLTNESNEKYKKLCLEVGAECFLDKSTEVDLFLNIVDSMHEKIVASS